MSNTTFEGRSIEDLKSSLHAIDHKIDDLKMDAAVILGILPLDETRRFWVSTEINWNDSRLDHLRDTFFELVEKSYEFTKHIGRLNAIEGNYLEYWEAEQKGLKFLTEHFNSFDEQVNFFKKNNLHRGMSSLKEELVRNPKFLEGVVL